ncbi:hypothetical protein [Domibacillus enclensis]|uniref:Uncharacterized protein n=1 Tax=Domibacillus enclensis TaxID=1017273 RepID=A0A1N6Y3W5_9BACI|nr:hypothetical protein [Domibacillus enclensis]OXS77503.1 hypothetical protein B1B05_11750 [Domibacillus enclensis]SIR09159.1 hypothetical protein SAMN05443094_105139 [Domibacillus enclensis]
MTSLHELQPGAADLQAVHILTKMAAEDDGVYILARERDITREAADKSDDEKLRDQYMLFSSLF